MSESKLESKDIANQRTPVDVEIESETGETSPVLQAIQQVKVQTTTEESAGNDGNKYHSFENILKVAKERCETLQGLVDRAAVGLVAETDKDIMTQLLNLLNTYRYGLACLLHERCSYYLLQGNYMELYYYANEFENITAKLSNASLLREDAIHLLSKKFVIYNFDTSVKNVNAYLLHANKDRGLPQDDLRFIEKCTWNDLANEEYALLNKLFGARILRCDFQISLDLCTRLLQIACDVQNGQKITDTLAQLAHLYLLLGKYQKSYNLMKEMQAWKVVDPRTHYILVGNFSVVELILGFKSHSLQHAWDSLDLALQTGDKGYIACAYGNIGLALEYMGMFDEAIDPYLECLRIGEEASDHRVINNGLCNLGRAYQGLGDIQKAKECFKKSVETPRPPKAFWCDTEDFRFSGDYLLGKLAVREKNWDEAKKYFMQVIERCETLRKRIQDSPVKITFNDTQRKPFQYLQHVMLEENKQIEALVVAEKGRGRDFFDKVQGDFPTPLDSEKVLLDMIRSKGISVLFISTLEEVGKLCMWFISSGGYLLKQWSIPNTECNELFTQLRKALHNTQGRHEIEFRGTTEEKCFVVEKAFQTMKRISPQKSDHDVDSSQPQSGENINPLDTIQEHATNAGSSHFSHTETKETTKRAEATASSSDVNYSLHDLIELLSKVILSPFQKELENLVNSHKGDDMPQLLIIPQGSTFDIPFGTLQLHGKPLCKLVTIIEAFSFNSFAYFTSESERRTKSDSFKNALVVGNPTHSIDLPRAEEEARRIGERLGVTPLIGEHATKEAVMKQLPSARLMHFACHGLMNGTGLVLACNSNTSYKDKHLTVEDVEGLNLDADLVVLSACHTALGQINSEGVLGLTRAFQTAGARSVVTALWAIPDEATKYFMEHFYGNLRQGQPVADAIRATQVTMHESEEFSDVIKWGSFKVFGANAVIM